MEKERKKVGVVLAWERSEVVENGSESMMETELGTGFASRW